MSEKPKAPKPSIALKSKASQKVDTGFTDSPSKWIRTERPFPLPDYVRQAVEALDRAGHVAYVVGGSVRDFLLGVEPKDHDIATSASPDEIQALFPRAITVGKAYGVIKVPLDGESRVFEIATFRKDLGYQDHRRPVGVEFAGPVEDATRRDFTVNGLFYDLKTKRVLDVVDGMEDLKAKRIRAIGDPSERFREDALRLVRAVRFATQLGFEVEAKTWDAVRARARLVTKVSAERIRDELTRMWLGADPARALQMLLDSGLCELILPEVARLRDVKRSRLHHDAGDAWSHTLVGVAALAKQVSATHRSPVLGWAAVLLHIGKWEAAQASGGKNFNEHEVKGAELAAKICERLKMSRMEVEAVQLLLGEQLKFREVFGMRESTLQRFVRQPGFEDLLALHRADVAATDGNLAYYEFCRAKFDEARAHAGAGDADKLLTGEDLIQLGLEPGPQFTEILRWVEDLHLEKQVATKEEALERVIQRFVR